MTLTKITETAIEKFTIELLEKAGYQYIYGPTLAPDKVNGEAGEGSQGYKDTGTSPDR